MKYAILQWEDAFSDNDTNTAETAPEYLLVNTIGWLVRETEESIAVMTDLIEGGEDRELHVIPKRNIRYMITNDIELWQPKLKRKYKRKVRVNG